MNPQEIRRTYAETLRTIANLRVEAIVEAFARVPREEFLGPAPWQTAQAQPLAAVPYRATPGARLEDIYQDVVGLSRCRSLAGSRCRSAPAPVP